MFFAQILLCGDAEGKRLRDVKLIAASILYLYVHKCTFIIGNAKLIAAQM